MRRSTVITLCSGTFLYSTPPSTSRPTVNDALSAPSSIDAANVACGQPSLAASIWPTWLASPSTACLPMITTSGFSAATIALSTLTTISASISASLAATWIARSAPIARQVRISLAASLGPSDTTTISPPGSRVLSAPFSTSRSAVSIAYSSNVLTIQVAPVRSIWPSLILAFCVGSGTRLTGTRIFTWASPSWGSCSPGAAPGRRSPLPRPSRPRARYRTSSGGYQAPDPGSRRTPRRDVARDRGVELAARLAVGDDAAQHAQEVGELRVVVLLHELARLPELDRQHLGRRRFVRHQLQVGVDEGAQLLGRWPVRDRLAQPVVDLLHPVLEQRDQQVVLALEVEVDRAIGDAGLSGDVRDPRGEEPVAREDPLRGDQDPLALVAAAIAAVSALGSIGR